MSQRKPLLSATRSGSRSLARKQCVKVLSNTSNYCLLIRIIAHSQMCLILVWHKAYLMEILVNEDTVVKKQE